MPGGKKDTIYALLKCQGERASESVAIQAPDRQALTYGGLFRQVHSIVSVLSESGIRRSDRVAIVLPNGPEMAVAFLGVAACASAAPLNPAYSPSEFEFYFSDLEPKALIVQSGTNSAVTAIAEKRDIAVIELSPDPEAAGVFTLKLNHRPVSSGFCFPRPEEVALVLHTSGTTSRPKIVPLSHANLLASAGNIATTLGLSEADRCLNVMPLFHIHGLVGALLSSVMAGAGVICVSGFDPDRFFTWLAESHPSWYTAVPTIHHAVLARAQADVTAVKNHSLRFIRSSSSALSPRLMQELEELFEVPVIESYGMTEAAHQMASNPLPPGLRKAGSVGLASGPEVSIMGEDGNLLSTGETGEIVIRGTNVTHGYEGDSEATHKAFTNGWFRTGDQGHLDTEGYLFITGRLKEIINRGGEKISPREIDEALLDHPDISQAVAFAMPHSTLGEDIGTAVVMQEKKRTTEEAIRVYLSSRLAAYKIPTRILFVDEIPKGATGKLQRIGLADKFAALLSGEPGRKILAPHTQVEKTLVCIWSEVLGIKRIGIDDNFFSLGGDSIRAMQVISRIRESMQCDLSISSFFAKPTVTGLAQCIENTLRTRSLLHTAPMQRVARNGNLPLSFAQQRLWFLDQLEPANLAYNRTLALRLTGELRISVIEHCINEIVRRHEVLRTNFHTDDSGPVQVISPNLSVNLPVIDLSHLPESEREAEALWQAIEEARQPFDLAHEALFRVRLYRMAMQDHLLLFVTHHIVFDGWSDDVLLVEIAAISQAILDGKPVSLPDLPFQYSDYTIWQRKQTEENVFDKELLYWKQQLSNPPPALNLPTNRPRPAAQTYRGARHTFTLPVQLADQLKVLSKHEHVTLFMTLAAAFKTLMCRYTGQEDIAVGVPTAGRNRVDTEQLLGVFINTIVLRTDLSGEPSFREVLRRVRQVAVDAYAHQDLPFEKLIEVLQPDRDLSRNPVFDVMFQLRNMPRHQVEMPGLHAACVELDIGMAKMDLTLEVNDKEEGLECRFEYSTDLFDFATISRMARHFHTLLEGIVANPEQRISELPLLAEAEKHQLLVEWNDTEADYPKDKCIHELFEAQVDKTPDAVALVFEDQQLTYRELNGRANQLARHLTKLDVGPDVLVGICMERSLEMVVGLLGILKAGGAYVPLDPAYPKERLEFMLEDSQARFLVTQARFEELISTFADRRVIVDRNWQEIARESLANIGAIQSPESLAYVIYTSGSTGNPKGVMVQHRSVVNFLSSMARKPGISETDVLLAVTTLSFDIAGLEIYLPLSVGARIVVVCREVAVDGTTLAKQISDCGATVMQATPAMWRILLAGGWQGSRALKILCGGEALPEDLAKELMLRCAMLWNMYGPTETTIWSAIQRVPTSVDRILLGRPIANTEIYILDSHLNPVPIGVAGELHIGGDGLARGYLNRPELTAEKFILNPFSTEPGTRLYKTGDLARYLPDGNIEFLGRIDNQIKIRGYRIELGEIESVLSQHPSVRETVVLVREDSPGDKRLVAYGVASPGAVPSATELRSFLQQKLLDYMVPSAFVFLKELPLTPNGKVDGKALLVPDQSRPDLDEGYVGPRSVTEQRLTQIWAEVLTVERVGVHDNFFHLGGHSLLAIRLLSLISKEFKREIPLRGFFESPTIEGVAKYLGAGDEGEATYETGKYNGLYLFLLKNGDGKSPVYVFPGGFGGENEALALAQIAHFAGPEYPFLGLRAKSSQGSERGHRSVEEMARDFLEEIRSFQPKGPYHLLGHCLGGVLAYEVACQLQDQGDEVGLLGFLDTFRPTKARYYSYLARRVIEKLIPNWQFYYRERFRHHLERLRSLGWQAKIDYITRRSKTLKEVFDLKTAKAEADSQPSPSLRELRDNQASHISTLLKYRPRPYRGRLFSLVADEILKQRKDDTLGWGRHVKGEIHVHRGTGSHESFIRDHIETVGALIRTWLEKVESEENEPT